MLARRAGDLQRTLGRILRSMAKSKIGTRGAARWLAAKNDPPGRDRGDEGRTGIATKTRPKTKKPSLYKVLLLNDDYTPMEFVVHILEKFFAKNREAAVEVM